MELGTAIGIASFGIQVCQGLLSYYDDWKSYDSDISSAYDATTDLSKTLTLLKGSLNRSLDEERAVRVKTCVLSCEDGLRELETKRQSLRKYSQPEGLRQKMKTGLQRTWYPFNKKTLEALKVSVIGVQGRLKLALQVLQVDIIAESQDLVVRLLNQTMTQSVAIAQIAAQNQRILDAQQSDEFRRIVAWLAPPDANTDHAAARRLHECDTGDWLLKSTQYQNWMAGTTDHLWVYGKAGCGKTILCSTAIEDIRSTCDQDADTSYAYFYFSFSNDRKQSDVDLLRSLVAQLGWREPGLSMLRQAYQNAKQSVPGPDELERLLLASIRSCSKVYLLVDALDECPEDHNACQNVLAQLERLCRDAPNLQVFATSRELERIRKSMKALNAEPLCVIAGAVDADIQTYLGNEISRDRSLCELKPEIRTLIENTIASRSDGMFRWAYLQLQELENLDSFKPKYVKQVLETLPPTLDDTYARMLTRIKKMYHQEALALLRWLAYARSPPTLGELVDAAITDPAKEDFVDTSERGGLRDALNILSGLVTIEENEIADEEGYWPNGWNTTDDSAADNSQDANIFHTQDLTADTRVRLAHFSVKEYLESDRILESKADQFHLESTTGHHFLAQSCLTYLRHYSISNDKDLPEEDLAKFPLLRYAAETWFYHSALQRDAQLGREASFLQLERARNDWLLVHDPDGFRYGTQLTVGTPLYYASLLGFPVVVSSLLGSGVDPDTQCGNWGSALQAASQGDHTEIARLLLDGGADIEALYGDYGNALQIASIFGCTETAKLLLERGAKINAQCASYGTPLVAASRCGHLEVVKLLLDRGANVNAECGASDTPLMAASGSGHLEVVKLLLDMGAEFNAQCGDDGTPLMAASLFGNIEVVKLLLDVSADITTQCGSHGTALAAALKTARTDVVRLLLSMGADINACSTRHGSPLQIALFKRNVKIAQLLIEEGADVNAQGGSYDTPLQIALNTGDTDICRLLINRGADVNAQGGSYDTPLQIALNTGDIDICRLLINKGADVKAYFTSYGTPLQIALHEWPEDLELVRLLIDRGADVNAQSKYRGSPLEIASERCPEDIVRLLLDNGARLDGADGSFLIALRESVALRSQ